MRALRAQDLKSILCMVQNCRPQIFDCLGTPECRKALDCLQQCAPNDQASLKARSSEPSISSWSRVTPPVKAALTPVVLDPLMPFRGKTGL